MSAFWWWASVIGAAPLLLIGGYILWNTWLKEKARDLFR